MPEKFKVNDSAILLPASVTEADSVEILRGPNIKPFPDTYPLEDTVKAELTLKVGDNITTDHIMPAGAKILPYRSNIPYLSKFCFAVCDETFSERAKAAGKSIIVGGTNYGQGSSREHAALVPLYLGVKAVVAKSFARIHAANLINAGIIPFTFDDPDDYDKLSQGDMLKIEGLFEALETGKATMTTQSGASVSLSCTFSERQREILKAGGLLPYTRK
jgi:aconitate hydratase